MCSRLLRLGYMDLFRQNNCMETIKPGVHCETFCVTFLLVATLL